MDKIDKRKSYYLMLDTETANGLDDPLVYDIGLAVVDKYETVYHTESLLIYDIYRAERDLMQTAYYAEKIPLYEKKYEAGLIRMVKLDTARKIIAKICKLYNIKAIVAHNARFDWRSTNTTLRWNTKSRFRYFLPYGIPIWDTLAMSRDTIAKQKSYIKFCEEDKENRMYKNKPRLTAEILYQFISGNDDFKEEHTGLADCLIEARILSYCLKQHKKMKKSPWKEKEKEMVDGGCPVLFSQDEVKPTPLQYQIMNMAKIQVCA